MYWLGQKVRLFVDKFTEGFMFGLGLYAFYEFAMWMEWLQ